MRTPRGLLLCLGCAALALAAVQGLTGIQELVFYAGPFLLLIGLLLSGRFPGEEAILARRPVARPAAAGLQALDTGARAPARPRCSSAARVSCAARRWSRCTSADLSLQSTKEVPLRILACTVAAAALLIGAPVALAHQGNPNYRSVVTSITPEVKGLDAGS